MDVSMASSGWDPSLTLSLNESDHYDVNPPSYPTARTIVLCFDGGDRDARTESNVAVFFSLLKKDDRNEQMTYYQSMESQSNAEEASFLKARIFGNFFSKSLESHVKNGYEFLMQHYQFGDKVCLFGCSPGAYIARALAGMIHKVGLLPAGNREQVPLAYKLYVRNDDVGWAECTAFKKQLSIDICIDFLGVWDTVASVGSATVDRLPFTASRKAVRVFRHALALDERRARRKPLLYHNASSEAQLETHTGDTQRSTSDVARDDTTAPTRKQDPREKQLRLERERPFNSRNFGSDSTAEIGVMEVWFAGCHCDVSGGSVPSSNTHALSRIPLRWMIRECFRANTGIRFRADMFKQVGLDFATLHPTVRTRPPAMTPQAGNALAGAGADADSEEAHDMHDALAPIYDQLILAPSWWIFEVLPTKQYARGSDENVKKAFKVNLGRGRWIPRLHTPFYVHRSVKFRMEALDKQYRPKARFPTEPVWVD